MTEDVSIGYSSSLPTDEAGASEAGPTTGKVLESSSAAVSTLFTECRMMKYRNKFFEVMTKIIIFCTVTEYQLLSNSLWMVD